MKTILNVIFDENLNYSKILFLLFLLGIEFLYLHKKELSAKCAVIITIVSVLFAGSVIVSSDAADDLYHNELKPNETGCFLDIYKEHYYYYYSLYLHYFEGKQLYICDDVDDKLEIAAHFIQYDKALPVEIGGMEYTSSKVFSELDEINDNTHCIDKDGRRFILDKTWGKSNKIICVKNDDQVYFMSEQLYLDASLNECKKDYLSTKELAMNPIKYMNKQRGEGPLKHIAVLMCFFVMGRMLTQLAFDGKKEWLSFFMAFPMGIFLACDAGVLFIIFGIPFRKLSMVVAFLAIVIVEIICFVRRKGVLRLKNVLSQFLGALLLSSLVSYLMIYKVMGDSVHKIGYGFIYSEFMPTRLDFLNMINFGFLDSIIHAIGWKFHADFMYGIYLLMGICIVGILVTSMIYLFNINENKYQMIFMLACIMILVTNVDFIGISVWVLTNGSIACISLIILVSAMFEISNQMHSTLVIAVASLSYLAARVEGTCYLCLLLVLLSGLRAYRERCWEANLVVGLEIIGWQLFQLMFSTTETLFWSPGKSYMLLVGGVVVILAPVVLRIQTKMFGWIRDNFYKLFLGILGIASVIILFSVEMGYETARIFLGHFGASDCSNSAAFWGFALLMSPIILKSKKKTSRMLITYVVCYLLITYCIFSFRIGVPIHEMYYDSCRRMISQFMPTVVFSIMFILYSMIPSERLNVELLVALGGEK